MSCAAPDGGRRRTRERRQSPHRPQEVQLREVTDRLGSLSIVIDDFDSETTPQDKMEGSTNAEPTSHPPRPYTRQSSDASIKKILDEAEHRKHEFWKLIDEHDAVVANLKRIEQQEGTFCKPIKT